MFCLLLLTKFGMEFLISRTSTCKHCKTMQFFILLGVYIEKFQIRELEKCDEILIKITLCKKTTLFLHTWSTKKSYYLCFLF